MGTDEGLGESQDEFSACESLRQQEPINHVLGGCAFHHTTWSSTFDEADDDDHLLLQHHILPSGDHEETARYY